MPTRHKARRALLVPAFGLAFAAALTACSSSSSSSSSSAPASPTAAASTSAPATPSASPTPTASASTAAASTPAAAEAAIKQTWVTFFNGKTPAATKVGLVENGSQFASVLKAQASNPQGATAGATVQKVTLTSATGAAVDYTITISGTPMLAGQKGTAILQDGTWKVSIASFCGLMQLEAAGTKVAGCPTS